MKIAPIPTYIINLKYRTDRKEHIVKEFAGRDEFAIQIVEACEHEKGSVGLWNSIQHIIHDLIDPNEKMIILCEDDHLFTDDYSRETFFDCISKADELGADILHGGISAFKGALQVSERLFWVDSFSGSQFIIVFNRFFKKLLEANFREFDKADYKIAALSLNKFFIHPFISIQKEFGYSDATEDNNIDGRVENLFRYTSGSAGMLKDITAFYKSNPVNIAIDAETLNTITVPTYIINLPERTERRDHILQQFSGKPEFDITLVEGIKHEVGALGLWLSIRKVIKMAMENDDDVIVICEDDHEFTGDYSSSFLFQNIMEAHAQGADYLSGGAGGLRYAIPITQNRYWLNPCFSTQFIIVFKKFFAQILDEPYDESVIADMQLSSMTGHKMVMYPFISIQKDFGYSDVTSLHDEHKGLITRLFMQSRYGMNKLQQAYIKYNQVPC